MIDRKKKAAAPAATEAEKKAEGSLPGRQMGLYGSSDKQAVSDMVNKLNPDKNSMDSRG